MMDATSGTEIAYPSGAKRLKCTTHMNDDGSGDNTSLKKSLKIPGVRRSHNLNKGRQ
jgi:hypothetical protein